MLLISLYSGYINILLKSAAKTISLPRRSTNNPIFPHRNNWRGIYNKRNTPPHRLPAGNPFGGRVAGSIQSVSLKLINAFKIGLNEDYWNVFIFDISNWLIWFLWLQDRTNSFCHVYLIPMEQNYINWRMKIRMWIC